MPGVVGVVFTAAWLLVFVSAIYWSGDALGSVSFGSAVWGQLWALAVALPAPKAADHKRGRIAPELHSLLEASRSRPTGLGIRPRAKARARTFRFVVAHAGGHPL